jgi:hypothetical protein
VEGLYEILLVDVLTLLLKKHILALQGSLHLELEFLAACIEELKEYWALHLKKLK